MIFLATARVWTMIIVIYATCSQWKERKRGSLHLHRLFLFILETKREVLRGERGDNTYRRFIPLLSLQGNCWFATEGNRTSRSDISIRNFEYLQCMNTNLGNLKVSSPDLISVMVMVHNTIVRIFFNGNWRLRHNRGVFQGTYSDKVLRHDADSGKKNNNIIIIKNKEKTS